MLTLTRDATSAIERILTNPEVPDGAGVRIESSGPSRSDNGAGAEGGQLRMMVAPEAGQSDVVIEDAGARVFVEPTVSDFLDDKVLDIASDGDVVQFTVAERPPAA